MRGEVAEDPGTERRTSLLAAGANLAVEATAAEVVRAFQRAGVRSILLKGPSLGRWLYGPESTRVSVDVDLLVAPGDRPAAEAVLARLGFAPFPTNVADEDEGRHAHAWDRDASAIGIDLHSSLPGVGVSDGDAWSVLSRRTEQVVVGAERADVLTPGARALHVALHAAQHGPGFEGPMNDLGRALGQLRRDVWQEAAALARELDATSMFAAGLGLLEPGQAVLEDLGVREPKTVEVALRASTPPDLALGFHRLASMPGLTPKLAFVARKLVPPPAWMRRCIPLARRGLLGLAAAYVLRPLSLLRRAGPGFRAWRRALREAR